MSDEEQEYEVESIQEAVVEKKRGKNGQLFWQFRVRWKGYTPEDDTWEPIESFEDSEQIIQDFWSRTKDQRDIRDLKKFRVGERFLPLGPPARKIRKTKSTIKAESNPQDDEKLPPETSKTGRDITSATILPISVTPPPPGKRRRGVLETDTHERAPKRQRDGVAAKSNGNTPAKTPKTPGMSGSNLGLSTPARRQSARRRKPSPVEIVPDSDEEVARFMKVDDDLDSPSHSVRDATSDYGVGSTSPPGSTNLTTLDPLFDEDAEAQAPAHRLKERNPLVKTFEDPVLSSNQGQLSAKSRAVGTKRKPSDPSSRKDPASSSTSQRPGPGRSSSGMLKKPVASLLTAAKGALKTIKGSYRRPVEQEQKQEDQDVLSEEKEAESPSTECVVAKKPPTAQELLTLAGFDKQDAEALPDFEDSGAGADAQMGGDDQESVLARERAESLKKAKESLFPTSAVSSDLPSATWNLPTIFGPLTAEPSTPSLPMEGGPDQ
ncbi:hypothetical protein EST38_g13036 [Candolleomyces aberdarensis]|uniref:Chromo domain-containing protein n=1 Tax=Candolleomyces aberdarensis TaxID=2316362 RepID=A0A4Q2D0W6_9AGAR|nr:hypothetical protein EST38_g13036 [Candolleomyces aberdarensis]